MENKVARTYLRRADFEQWGFSERCPGCRHLKTCQGRQQAHNGACRKRIEGLLKSYLAGSARLATADERINRALARDQGSRSEGHTKEGQCCPSSSENLRRKKHWTLSRTPHHTLQFHTESHQRQVHDQTSPQALTRTPAHAT